jgi:hypothetical protein
MPERSLNTFETLDMVQQYDAGAVGHHPAALRCMFPPYYGNSCLADRLCVRFMLHDRDANLVIELQQQ